MAVDIRYIEYMSWPELAGGRNQERTEENGKSQKNIADHSTTDVG
jgi:hypothetical protein